MIGNIQAILHDLNSRGITLSANGDMINISAPKGVLNADVVAMITKVKPELLIALNAPEDLQAEPTDCAEDIITEAVSGLDTTANELISLNLIDDYDLKDIESGRLTVDQLRLYAASWILAGKTTPFQLNQNYAEFL